MTTIPQVARAVRETLTTTAAEAGRTTRFVQRTSPLSGATFSQTLVFGLLGNPQAPLEELTQTAAALGVAISPQALDQRFTASAAACLHQVLLTAIARVITAEPVAIPLLERFTAVSVQDSSTLILPAVFAAQWHGCSGSTASSASAALKLQARVEMRTGRLAVQLQEGCASDRAASLPGPLPAGALRLADLGYWSLGAFAALAQQKVVWRSRLQMQPAVYDATGARQEILTLLKTQPTDTIDLAVALGERQHLGARLWPYGSRRTSPIPAVDACGQPPATKAVRSVPRGWRWLPGPFVTNVSVERLTLREALGLGRLRWQMELLFKLWKSHGRVDESRSTKPWRILCEVYAQLLAMLVQHWVFLVSFWAYPDRSLTKAAQTVQKHAMHLASAFASVQRLGRVLLTVKRCLTVGCRMNRRKKPPNTYQLLLQATGP
jgi:hypothetical protein